MVIIYHQSGEGNPNAYQSQKPLNGGNFTEVKAATGDNGGLLHEVSLTWGGSHFVYPNDIMSGGGSWFGPTTNQRHIYVKNNPNVTNGVPVVSGTQLDIIGDVVNADTWIHTVLVFDRTNNEMRA